MNATTAARLPIDELKWQAENWNAPDDPTLVLQLSREEYDSLISTHEQLLAALQELVATAAVANIAGHSLHASEVVQNARAAIAQARETA
jgi:hypothetical protein